MNKFQVQNCFIFTTAILLVVVNGGNDVCRTTTIQCYDCDSRHDPHCADPFNRSLPLEVRPAVKMCSGCCLKISHRHPRREHWIQRTCTENIIINYFIVDHVCLTEGHRHGKMCFCEEPFCNHFPPLTPQFWMSFAILLILYFLQ